MVVRFGDVTAVAGVSLVVAPGSVMALLGPSGSGKSTLLRAVAGLEPLAGGTVRWNGTVLAGVKVHKRGFGMVVQHAQLFPSMTVGTNIAYGLRSLSRARQRERVTEMLDLVGMPGAEDRRVTELSGGQAQRVALARSLAPSPRALLLDEPLAAVDGGSRSRLTEDLARILHATGTTAVHVTHDHQEAFAVADSVAVLQQGRLVQVDDAEALRLQPASKDVAALLGYRAFVTERQARDLGWPGRLPTGAVLAIGPDSLTPDDAGIELAVIDQAYTVDGVEIGVVLPDGQRAAIAASERVDVSTIRVRLTGGAVTPA